MVSLLFLPLPFYSLTNVLIPAIHIAHLLQFLQIFAQVSLSLNHTIYNCNPIPPPHTSIYLLHLIFSHDTTFNHIIYFLLFAFPD